MDLIGPLPETPRGNKYIITLTDYFSKWAEAAPLPNKSADGIARFMYSVSIYHTVSTGAVHYNYVIIIIVYMSTRVSTSSYYRPRKRVQQ